jgi:endoglucanase
MVAELAKLLAKKPLKNIRVLHTIATHEEIGRMGAAAIAGEMKPDILIGADVNHDYDAGTRSFSKANEQSQYGQRIQPHQRLHH